MKISIKELQEAVAGLPPEDFVRFRRWFEAFDAQRWDEQFENDVRSGKLDKIAERARQDFASGHFKEL